MTENERVAFLSAHGRATGDLFMDTVPLVMADLCSTCECIYDRRNPSGCPKCGSTAASNPVSQLWGMKQ